MTNTTLEQLKKIPEIVKVTMKLTTMKNLYKHHKPVEVEGYCSACPSYGRIWSCPPFTFDVNTYLAPYEHALIISVKTTDFEMNRRRFGDILKAISEEKNLEVLIAGNCYHCEVCHKVEGKPCHLENGTKYSLEALGFHVGDICKHILNAPLKWSGADGTYTTVGAILSNSKDELEVLI